MARKFVNGTGMADGRIFISYRRMLDQGTAGRLYDRLERHYDRDCLFMDVDDIPLGIDFTAYLQEQVARCAIFLAVIGRGWLDAADRLHNEADFVRIEIDAALQRAKVPVIPVLIDGAQIPAAASLPPALRTLCRRNGIHLRHDSFAADVDDRLCSGLNRLLGRTPDQGPTPARRAFSSFREHPAFPEMIVVPSGSFLMGSPPDEEDRRATEGPQRAVTVPSFALAATTVTFDQWAACSIDGGKLSNPEPDDWEWGRGKRPVTSISWNDAQEFIAWMNSKVDGAPYRLPTEAEWEYACRAGTTTPFSFGSTIGPHQARFDPTLPYGRGPKGKWVNQTAPVDALEAANPWGFRHMHGNVGEWVQDMFGPYAEAPSDGSPRLPDGSAEDVRRVVRGGYYASDPDFIRSASRFPQRPDNRDWNGLRPARSL